MPYDPGFHTGTITGTLKIDEIPGESLRSNHEDEIDFHALRWQIRQNTSAQVGKGRTQGRAEVTELILNKYIDASSPDLALACLKSQNFPEMVATLRKDSGDEPLDYFIITMKDVIVSRYEILGTPENTNLVEEQIGLVFQLVEIGYTVQNEDYTPGDEFTMAYDIGAAQMA